jgi:hypothetical protein
MVQIEDSREEDTEDVPLVHLIEAEEIREVRVAVAILMKIAIAAEAS